MGDMRKNLFFNKRRETMDWEKRKGDQNERFLKAFRHAWEHSKAYREIYGAAGVDPSDIRDVRDLEKLPILRMAELVQQPA